MTLVVDGRKPSTQTKQTKSLDGPKLIGMTKTMFDIIITPGLTTQNVTMLGRSTHMVMTAILTFRILTIPKLIQHEKIVLRFNRAKTLS